MAKFILADDFVIKWATALGIDADRVRRVVIDAEAGNAIMVYVEQYGTDELLHLDVPNPTSMDIKIVGAA